MCLWRGLTGMWALWCRAWVWHEELVISNKVCVALCIYIYIYIYIYFYFVIFVGLPVLKHTFCNQIMTQNKLHHIYKCIHFSGNEELNDPYSLPNIVRVVKSRRMRWAGHVACMGEDRGVHRVLVGKPEGKRPLGRPRHRWEDNMKMDLQEVGGSRGDWMELAQDRDRWQALVGTVRDFRVP